MKKDIEIIAEHYGLSHQLTKTVEELQELVMAILYYKDHNRTIPQVNLLEEIADVEIMLEQVKLLLNNVYPDTAGIIDAKKYFKIDRQLTRIERENTNE